jgi:hypothetical protein
MQNYIAQKAQQALEALSGGNSLPERLNLAKIHFTACEQYLDEAPDDVRQHVRNFLNSDIEHDLGAASLALQSAIQAVFEECGRQDEREGHC